jgi:hypothetical protein
MQYRKFGFWILLISAVFSTDAIASSTPNKWGNWGWRIVQRSIEYATESHGIGLLESVHVSHLSPNDKRSHARHQIIEDLTGEPVIEQNTATQRLVRQDYALTFIRVAGIFVRFYTLSRSV